MEWTSAAAVVSVFLLGQTLASVIWLTRLGARVDAIERSAQENNEAHNRFDSKIEHFDTVGTRAMAVQVDRLNNMFRRLERLENRVFNGRYPPVDKNP